MQKVIETADVQPRDRLAYWHDVSGKVFVGHECRIGTPHNFNTSVHHAALGPVEFIDVVSDGLHEAGRLPKSISHGEDDVFYLCLQLEGSARVSQDGRDTVVEAGGFHLQDTRRPYWSHYSPRWHQLIVKIPRTSLSARLASVSQLTARAIPHSNSVGGLVSDFIRLIHARIDTLKPNEQQRLGEQVPDLVALALASHSQDRPQLSSARSIAVLQLRAAIDARLDDPTLDPEMAAGAAGISVRYANALLAEDGSSIQRLIVQRRLERCQRDLADIAQSHRTVSEIAFAWGFSNLSHFNRRFKRAAGCTPGDYRRQHLR
jgi:AraC family transcriptional activator of tynA and feaB